MDSTVENLKCSQSLSYMFLFLLPILVPSWDKPAIGITGKVPNPTYKPAEANNSSVHLCEALAGSSPSHPVCKQVVLRQHLLLGKLWGGSAQILLFLYNWQSAEIPVGSWWAAYIKACYAAATRLGEMITVVGNYVCKIETGSTVSVHSVRSSFSSF